MEMDENGYSLGPTMRIWVSIDVSLPLKRALKLRTGMEEEHLVSHSYERLPNCCYLCDRLGYIVKYCELLFFEGFVDPGEDTPYGPCLWAPTPARNMRQRPSRQPNGGGSGEGGIHISQGGMQASHVPDSAPDLVTRIELEESDLEGGRENNESVHPNDPRPPIVARLWNRISL
ncbi:hypothetical protein Salat_1164500 [Sesamum alatum]|uniref:Zinc knuckle CX2CX4HX4C domain-containing protein n=1 Tax=Sesamum alatum TaxID=300844 RepID=A0AAE1YEL4_9LAMI|nr:hypothetical protein Salat_1164500 [Sesamum alatum]